MFTGRDWSEFFLKNNYRAVLRSMAIKDGLKIIDVIDPKIDLVLVESNTPGTLLSHYKSETFVTSSATVERYAKALHGFHEHVGTATFSVGSDTKCLFLNPKGTYDLTTDIVFIDTKNLNDFKFSYFYYLITEVIMFWNVPKELENDVVKNLKQWFEIEISMKDEKNS